MAATFGILGGLALGFMFLRVLPIAELHPAFLLALPLGLLLVTAFVMKPKVVLASLILTRSLLDPVLEITKGGGVLGLGAVLNLFVVMMTAFLVLREPGILRTHFAKCWALFLFLCGLSLLHSPMPLQGLRLAFNLTSYFCMALLPALVDGHKNDKRFWIKCLLLSTVLPVLMANLDFVRGGKFSEDAGSRIFGTFTHPNILAFYLLWVLAMIFYVWKSGMVRLGALSRFGLALYFLNVLAVLIATKTRNAWIGLWLFFLIYGILKEKKYLVACLSLVAAALALPPILARFGDLFVYSSYKLNSFAWRMEVWKLSFPATLEKWAFGHGLATFRDLSGAFLRRNPLVTGYHGVDAHNVYLQLWFEAGIFCLLAYLAIFWQLLKDFFARYRRSVAGLSKEYAIVIAYTLVYLISGIADNLLFYLAMNWYVWFFWGVLLKSQRFQRLAWVGPRAKEAVTIRGVA